MHLEDKIRNKSKLTLNKEQQNINILKLNTKPSRKHIFDSITNILPWKYLYIYIKKKRVWLATLVLEVDL